MQNKYLPSNDSISKFFSLRILSPRLKDKEKINAVLRYAVWSGKIKKPKICLKCGVLAKRICGHHHKGYLKENALEVVWLCDRCHSVEHLRK